jgi:hypothetical protein
VILYLFYVIMDLLAKADELEREINILTIENDIYRILYGENAADIEQHLTEHACEVIIVVYEDDIIPFKVHFVDVEDHKNLQLSHDDTLISQLSGNANNIRNILKKHNILVVTKSVWDAHH